MTYYTPFPFFPPTLMPGRRLSTESCAARMADAAAADTARMRAVVQRVYAEYRERYGRDLIGLQIRFQPTQPQRHRRAKSS